MRPCFCEKCHLCELWYNDERYQKMWSAIKPTTFPKLEINAQKRHAVIVLSLGHSGRRIFQVSESSLRKYAEKIDCDFYVIEGEPVHPSCRFEDKFQIGQFLNHYDRIIYFNPDTLISDDAPNLFDIVPESKVGMCNEKDYCHINWWATGELARTQIDNKFEIKNSDNYYNSGLIVASKHHKKLFDNPNYLYSCEEFYAEQHLINCRILEHKIDVFDINPDLVSIWFYDREANNKPFRNFSGSETNGIDTSSLMKDAEDKRPSYVINLNRRKDRLENVFKQFSKSSLNLNLVCGVDGKLTPLPANWKNFSQSTYGCNRSHVKVLNLAKGMPVFVFEDDVSFVEDFDNKLKEFLLKVPGDWDAIFLGGQHVEKPIKIKDGVFKCNCTRRTHGYMIRGKYAEFILDKWEKEVGHIDIVWGNYQKNWNVYAPEKWLCGQIESHSDIKETPLNERWWNLSNPNPQTLKKIIPTQSKSCGCNKK